MASGIPEVGPGIEPQNILVVVRHREGVLVQKIAGGHFYEYPESVSHEGS